MNGSSSGPAEPQLDIVFVHGLGSDAGAWVNSKTNFNWPQALDRNRHYRAFPVEYFSPMFSVNDSTVNADYQSLALKLLVTLKNKDVGTRPIVFVAHSLGGIIVKQALRVAEQTQNPIFEKVRSVIFLSTPHAGASIATLGAQLKKFLPVSLVSSLTSQLQNADPPLLELNRWYRTITEIETHAFYETNHTYAVLVVDPLSADPGVFGCMPVRADDKDHLTISKPEDENDELFVTIAKLLEGVWEREQEGKRYPVLRRWIREILDYDTLRDYRDAGNFRDVPIEFRRRVEHRLRHKLRDKFKAAPLDAGTERRLQDSDFDFDAFALSLWLEKTVSEQLEALISCIEKTHGAVRVSSKPATLIPFFRAARTLDRVLFGRNYGALAQMLNAALETMTERHAKDASFDGDASTRKLLKKLAKAAQGFHAAIQ
jgi:pimeloyl-ACP methyl ester carboxylesterase